MEPAAAVLLVLLGAVWAWWAAKQGGYFSSVWLPGTIALCGGLALVALWAPWRGELRLSRGVPIALAGLAGLGGWYALSALWSPAPDVAVADGQRVLGYAVAFGLGIWLANLLDRRLHLCLVPLVVAGAFAGLLALGGILTTGHPGDYLEVDGTLQFPLDYRNANAAFFAIAVWPALGLALRRELDWRLRGVLTAVASLCLDLAMLSQSRGAVLAGAVAVVVFLAFAPERARWTAWLALVSLPAALVVPPLIDLYRAANDGGVASATAELHAAGAWSVVATALAGTLGALAARFEGRLARVLPSPKLGRGVFAALLAALAAVAAIGFAVLAGNPADWVSQRVAEFRSGREPSSASSASRFSFDAGSARVELWRVALVDAGNDPLRGDGGGGYRYSYLRERHSGLTAVRDAHSIELEVLSELGVPGLALLACALGGATAGALRARRLGPSAAVLSAIGLTVGAYWLVHSSLDWFWPYPAVTAPTLALLGSACAPALRTPGAARPGRGRLWLVAAAVVLAVSAIPPFLAQRYLDAAREDARADPARAYDDLDRARALNPLSADPLLVEGSIARANDDRRRAIAAFRAAVAKRPEDRVPHYFLARLYARDDPRLAAEELAAARERDPLNPQLARLARHLRHQDARRPSAG
jgi:hypothetical protein